MEAPERTARVDALLAARLAELPGRAALVALGAYGSRELTPHAEVELLVLHRGDIAPRAVAEVITYPLLGRGLRAEAAVRTVGECVAAARRSAAAAISLLDARV